MIKPTSSFTPPTVRSKAHGHAAPQESAGPRDSVSVSGNGRYRESRAKKGWHGWHEGLNVARQNIENGVLMGVGNTPLSAVAARLGVDVQPVKREFDGTTDLKVIADRVLKEHKLVTEFPPSVLSAVAEMKAVTKVDDPNVRDMRNMLWCSIDNGVLDPKTLELHNASMDLDQLTVAEDLGNGRTRIYVGIADVDALVTRGSEIDKHAMANTRTVYTPDKIYPMIPEKLSTDLTSLAPDVDRPALVKEYVVNADGTISDEKLYRALVHNYGKMAYDSVAAWLDGSSVVPKPIRDVPGMADQIRIQDAAAQRLKAARKENGSLVFADRELKADMKNGHVIGLGLHSRNRATELIENFMVAANGVTARFVEGKGLPSLRRVVKTPEKWDRIVALAKEKGTRLPKQPDSKALAAFLDEQREKDPDHYPDTSTAIVKLLGRGEYVVEHPGQPAPGHFALAVEDYAHSTAPNRRGPDLVGQRIEKAAINGQPCPYSDEELDALAAHFTEQEHEVDKAERQISKSAAAQMLMDKIGSEYDAMVTGAGPKGTWVRVLDPPVEGKLVKGLHGLDVGDKVHVKLLEVNVERGFIDFGKA
jgi:exoribonuclease-2